MILEVDPHEFDMIVASVLLKGENLYREFQKISSKTRKSGKGRIRNAGDMVSHYRQKQVEYEILLSKLRSIHNSR